MSDTLTARDFGQPAGGQRIDLLTGAPEWGPMTIEANHAFFGQSVDPTLAVGYNYGAAGHKPMANEASMYWMVEGNYDRSSEGINDQVMEQYWEARSADNSIQWRPIFAMADKSAANGDRDTFIKSLDLFGPAPTGGGTGTTGGIRMFSAKDGPGMSSDELTYTFGRGTLRMEGFNEYNSQLQIRAGATKNASVQLGSMGVDNSLALTTAAPNVGLLTVGPAGAAQMWFTGVNGSQGMSVGINSGGRSSAVLDVDLKGTWRDETGIRVRQQVGGTGNLLQAEDSAGIVGSGFDRSGYIFTQLQTAPAATDLRPGEANFWFDSTAGASRLMVTAKDTGGTVVTGSVSLLSGTQTAPAGTAALSYDPVDGANVMSLGSGNDTVAGLETLDIIFGGAGNDTLSGNGGNDILYGGLGADTLIGGEGNDALWGNGGNDTLIGGTGADTYHFAKDSGADLITGFNPNEGDKLALHGQSYTTGSNGQDLTLALSGGGAVTLQGVAPNVIPAQSWFG